MIKRFAALLLLLLLTGCGAVTGSSSFLSANNGKSAWVKITCTESSSGVSGYDLYRSGVSGGPYAHLAGPLSGCSYTDTAVTRGGVYYYVMTATSTGGTSGFSNELRATP